MRVLTLAGRIRMSTALIALLFVITLATYLLVRPLPASLENKKPPASPTTKQQRPVPRPVSPRVTVDPSAHHGPSATATPRDSGTASGGTSASSPPASGGTPSPAPVPSPSG
jgi:hypothetical protein